METSSMSKSPKRITDLISLIKNGQDITCNISLEKPGAVQTANERLKILFSEFDQAKINYKPCFFG